MEEARSSSSNSAFSLGIDVGKTALELALRDGEETVAKTTVSNDSEGHESLMSWLLGRGARLEETCVCMESSGDFHKTAALCLHKEGYRVSVVNPRRIKEYASSPLLGGADLFGLGLVQGLVTVLLVVLTLTLGGVLGGTLLGLYLVLMNRLFGVHSKVFSCQHNPHYKNVLRLHVGDGGEVTMYPIGVPTVETNWQLRPKGAPQDPWFDGEISVFDRAELIEPPVQVQ